MPQCIFNIDSYLVFMIRDPTMTSTRSCHAIYRCNYVITKSVEGYACDGS